MKTQRGASPRCGALYRSLCVTLAASTWLVTTSLRAADAEPEPALAAAVPDASALQDFLPEESSVLDHVQFLAARKALAAGDKDGYETLKASLEAYPLYHFLVYEELAARIERISPEVGSVAMLDAFEASSGDPALTRKLTRKLQSRAVETEQWDAFLAISERPDAANRSCATLRARFETGQLKTLDDAALATWVKPARQNAVCQSVLETLEQRKTPPIRAIWEKIYLGIEKDRPEAVEPLLSYLSRTDRAPVLAWLKARKNPARFLRSDALKDDTALNRRILVNLVLAWSRDDTVAAMAHWRRVRDRFRFFADRYYETDRKLAMRGAYRRLPEAYGWLDSLDIRDDDLEAKEWRVRAALFERNWPEVIRSIRRLPAEEQAEDHWAYWEARVLELSGDELAADTIYRKLAELQSYHGFLSADRLGLPYAIENVPIEADPTELQELANDPRMVRAREYHRVQLPWEGRREWNAALRNSSKERLAAAAVLAKHWRLHDRAIFNAGQAEHKQALEFRFPVLYEDAVTAAAQENSIDVAWVFGVMRRESAYIADVRSSAGAMGLMQLMPRTAKFVAELKGDKNFRGDLTEPTVNIGLGTHYLRHVMDKFEDHQVLATASYNAGPHRVKQWLPEADMDADVWIDAIPYTETRRYVRAVLAYTAIYEWHLTRNPRRLSEKLGIVEAAGDA